MALRVSNLTFDVISKAPEVVVPQPLPPTTPIYFPANWLRAIKIETTFLSDATQSKETMAEERCSLSTRPLRKISADLLVDGREAVESMGISYARFCSIAPESAIPFPIYCDATYCSAAMSLDTPTGFRVVPCDTEFRRFFLGQRIMLVHPQNSASFAGGVRFGIIEKILSDRLYVSGVSVDFPVDSAVYPCIDAQLTFSMPTNLTTARVAQVSISAQEAPGPSQLPSIWSTQTNGIAPASRQPWNYAGYAPIWALNHNWKNSTFNIEVARDGAEEEVGKGSVLDSFGQRPIHSITATLTPLSREEHWGQLRLFESRRGRANPFFVLSPRDGLSLISVTTTAVRFSTLRSGDLEIEPFFDYVFLEFPQSAIGLPVNPEVREIAAVNQIDSVTVEISWSEPLSGYSSLTPTRVEFAHLCRLASDSIVEEWMTDSVSKIQIRAVEQLEEADVSVANLPVTPGFKTPISDIPDLQFWFSSKNSFSLSAFDTYKTLVRAEAFPLEHSGAHRIYDSRLELPDSIISESLDLPDIYLQEFGATANHSFVIQVRDNAKNGGMKPIVNAAYKLSLHDPANTRVSGLPNTHKSLWSNTAGWTFVAVLTGGTLGYQDENATILDIKDSAGGSLFWWKIRNKGPTGVTFGSAQLFATPNVQNLTFAVDHLTAEQGQPIILILRWLPGGLAEVWMRSPKQISGSANDKFTSSATIGSLAMPALGNTFGATNWLGPAMDFPLAKQTGIADLWWRKLQMMNSIMSFKRGLTISELNALGVELGSIYNIPWRTITS